MASSRQLPTAYTETTYGNGTRDYTSLAAWESATDNDLVTATNGEVLTCYDDSAPYNDTVTVAGATTNSSYFRVIRGSSVGSASSTSGARFESSTVSNIFYINENYFGAYDIAGKATRNATGTSSLFFIVNATECKFVGCFAYDCANPTTNAVGFYAHSSAAGTRKCYFINCVADGGGAASGDVYGFVQYVTAGTMTPYCYNCTAVNNDYGFDQTSGTGILKNSIAQSNNITNILGSWTETTNATSGVTFDTDGYHLDSTDTGAIDSGTDLSADATFAFDDDIDGDTRSGTWDIGCDEYVAAASGFISKMYWYSPG